MLQLAYKPPMQASLVVLDKKLPPCTIRLSVRTLPFHGRKRSSILLSCTRFNYIGFPDPVGCMSIGCLDEDGCVVLSWKMETKWSLHARRCWYGNSSSLGSLECNVRCDQSLDDSVVSHRVMIVADHPSVIKCGISFADVSHGLDHAWVTMTIRCKLE